MKQLLLYAATVALAVSLAAATEPPTFRKIADPPEIVTKAHGAHGVFGLQGYASEVDHSLVEHPTIDFMDDTVRVSFIPTINGTCGMLQENESPNQQFELIGIDTVKAGARVFLSHAVLTAEDLVKIDPESLWLPTLRQRIRFVLGCVPDDVSDTVLLSFFYEVDLR